MRTFTLSHVAEALKNKGFKLDNTRGRNSDPERELTWNLVRAESGRVRVLASNDGNPGMSIRVEVMVEVMADNFATVATIGSWGSAGLVGDVVRRVVKECAL